MLITFTKMPVNRNNIDGIQEQSALDELAALCGETTQSLIEGHILLSIPDRQAQASMAIKSPELRNIFAKYAGEEIYIDKDDTNAEPNAERSNDTPTGARTIYIK